MIQKLEPRHFGPDSGFGGATFSDVIDKVNEIIDAMNGKQKKQKPISSCDIVPYIDEKIAALQDMWREEKVSFDWDDMKDMIEDVARHFYHKEQKPSTGIYWHAIKRGEKLPCRAYIWNPDYEKYHDCWEGKLIPNVENIRVGADTWYLPAKDVRDLPREGLDELQKENPKYADPIPADCVSDVKCEDRWHKVQDSLPDNGRLVLANDCLGNMLLARYDGEGNWEVSVYDNDDYYCRNTITKWCEIPSEKQKEQKPTSFNEPYNPDEYEVVMEGNATSIKQQEQKPAWSEDYREEDIQTRFAFYTYKDDPSVLYLSNVFVEEASRNHGFGTRILKAAEKAAEAIGAITICLKVKQDSPANAWYRKNGYGYVAFEDGYDWLEKNLEYLKPAKSAEWSEEDEKMLSDLRNTLGCLMNAGAITFKTKKKFSNWLKSLRPSKQD